MSGSILQISKSMKMMRIIPLLLALCAATVAWGQDVPTAREVVPEVAPAKAEPELSLEPVEMVKAAIPVPPPTEPPPTFTQDHVREMERAMKRKLMLVGMGCGVAGLLLGMLIGRKSAPRATGRRY